MRPLQATAFMGGAVTRAGGVASDFVGTGRRIHEFARDLCGDEPELGHLDRARLVASAGADEFLLTLVAQIRAPDPDTVAGMVDEARALVDHLGRHGVLDDPASFHVPPRVPDLDWRSRSVIGRRFEHVTFKSPYAPGASVPGATRYAEHTGNETAHAWMLRQPSAAPWIVGVHGAGMGDPLIDLVLFRAAALHRRGFNVALAVLPHHGPRGAGRFELAFPGVDLVGNLHGASQAISDVRAVLAYIRARGEPAVLHGISLGGYVAASVAALEPSLAAVVVGVPVVSLAEVIRTHSPRRPENDERLATLFEQAEKLEAVTSPIRLGCPATPVRRVYAGRADRLVRPDHVVRLVDHWGVEDVMWYPGGHMGFMTGTPVRHCLDEALLDAGVGRDDDGHVVAV